MNEGQSFAELDKTEVDFTGVETEFKALPEAIYQAVVESVELKHADGDPLRPYLSWTFVIPAHNNRKAWLNTSLQSQSLWRVKKVLEAFGADVTGVVNIGQTIRDCIGKACKLWLSVKIFEGKEKNEVADVLPDVGAPPPF